MVVSTSEGEHVEAVLQAIEAGKAVLVEKPIALTLADADRILAAIAAHGADVRVGYSRRFRKRYQIAKEQIVRGRMGRLLGAQARVYNSRSQALAMLARNPHATPVVDALTYYVDLMNWFFEGRRLTEVIERPLALKADAAFIAGLNRETQSRRLLERLDELFHREPGA